MYQIETLCLICALLIPPGTFSHSGVCVEAAECPCVYQKQEHAAGAQLKINCNQW